jgi:hypothetical protein
MQQLAVAIGLPRPSDRPLGLQESLQLAGEAEALHQPLQRRWIIFRLLELVELLDILALEPLEGGLVRLVARAG